jgi:hypothetical protein
MSPHAACHLDPGAERLDMLSVTADPRYSYVNPGHVFAMSDVEPRMVSLIGQ